LAFDVPADIEDLATENALTAGLRIDILATASRTLFPFIIYSFVTLSFLLFLTNLSLLAIDASCSKAPFSTILYSISFYSNA
jgi:hypothetical protein